MIAYPTAITLLRFNWALIRVEGCLDLLINHHKQFKRKGHYFKYAGNHILLTSENTALNQVIFFKGRTLIISKYKLILYLSPVKNWAILENGPKEQRGCRLQQGIHVILVKAAWAVIGTWWIEWMEVVHTRMVSISTSEITVSISYPICLNQHHWPMVLAYIQDKNENHLQDYLYRYKGIHIHYPCSPSPYFYENV